MNLEEVRTLLQAYDLGRAPLALSPINKGLENENYRVEAATGQYVLRVYSLSHATTGPRSRADLALELDWIDHLRRRKVPTPAVIRTQAGAINQAGAQYTKAIIARQTRYAALFEYVPGEEAQAYSAENARSVARTLLQIRKASRDFQYTTIRAWPGDIIRLSLDFYRKHREQHRDKHRDQQTADYQPVLKRLYEEAVDGYHQIQTTGLPRNSAKGIPRGIAMDLPLGGATDLLRGVATDLPRGIIHGDIKLENLLFKGDQVQAVLDFDDYRESYLLEELTRTVMHDLDSPTRNAVRAGCFPVFRQVFASDSDVSAAELAHLPTFLKARFLYDITAYLLDGNQALVDALFADPQVKACILS